VENFAVEVISIREATEHELANGHVHGPGWSSSLIFLFTPNGWRMANVYVYDGLGFQSASLSHVAERN
jgi:hypothetical protein